MPNIHVIIVAGGSGARFGAPLPKQFCLLAERPVVMHAIDALRDACPEAAFTLALAPSEYGRWASLCEQYNFSSPSLSPGGASRWESVKNALSTVAPDCSLVLIHDGARPLPSHAMIDALLQAFDSEKVDGAVPAIAVTDSLRLMDADGINSTPYPRANLRAVQTPQAFRYDLLMKAYELPYQPDFTDDASVMEAAGYKNILITPGEPTNIKITHPLDIAIAEAILK